MAPEPEKLTASLLPAFRHSSLYRISSLLFCQQTCTGKACEQDAKKIDHAGTGTAGGWECHTGIIPYRYDLSQFRMINVYQIRMRKCTLPAGQFSSYENLSGTFV